MTTQRHQHSKDTTHLGGGAPLHLIAQQVRCEGHAEVEAEAVEQKEELYGVSYVLPCSMRQRAEAQPVEHEPAHPSRRASAYMWGKETVTLGSHAIIEHITMRIKHAYIMQALPNMSLPVFLATNPA